MAIDPSSNTQIQIKQEGKELVIGPTGTLTVVAGATVTGLAAYTEQAAIADLTDNSGGAAANGTIGAVTAPSALTDSSTGSASTTLAAMTGVDGAGSNAAPLTATKNAVASLAARQAENRTALIALTDAVTELATKVNAILASLRAGGAIDT